MEPNVPEGCLNINEVPGKRKNCISDVICTAVSADDADHGSTAYHTVW